MNHTDYRTDIDLRGAALHLEGEQAPVPAIRRADPPGATQLLERIDRVRRRAGAIRSLGEILTGGSAFMALLIGVLGLIFSASNGYVSPRIRTVDVPSVVERDHVLEQSMRSDIPDLATAYAEKTQTRAQAACTAKADNCSSLTYAAIYLRAQASVETPTLLVKAAPAIRQEVRDLVAHEAQLGFKPSGQVMYAIEKHAYGTPTSQAARGASKASRGVIPWLAMFLTFVAISVAGAGIASYGGWLSRGAKQLRRQLNGATPPEEE